MVYFTEAISGPEFIRAKWCPLLSCSFETVFTPHGGTNIGLLFPPFFQATYLPPNTEKIMRACQEFSCARKSPTISEFSLIFVVHVKTGKMLFTYALYSCLKWYYMHFLICWDGIHSPNSSLLWFQCNEWVTSFCSSAAENTEKKILCQNLWELSRVSNSHLMHIRFLLLPNGTTTCWAL